MKTIPVRIDQAVWERLYVEIEVPDELEGEELRDFLHEAAAGGLYKHLDTDIVGLVEHHDTVYEADLKDDGNYVEI
ncbi:hypothetical protein H4CHR_02913 [Variovorax sp. PBS-H4]|uniref:hypothetical protein n=1 Tax=Variovorax sp. PBS-H4 TaxID=434008 RepID=UPI001317EB94|nr:hypothetical protein [Variovorax sp. PBS-H4]VTU31958.1 hypothetical protein H4CHR_02913 [Variovorax sp. PBS-H4]